MTGSKCRSEQPRKTCSTRARECGRFRRCPLGLRQRPHQPCRRPPLPPLRNPAHSRACFNRARRLRRLVCHLRPLPRPASSRGCSSRERRPLHLPRLRPLPRLRQRRHRHLRPFPPGLRRRRAHSRVCFSQVQLRRRRGRCLLRLPRRPHPPPLLHLSRRGPASLPAFSRGAPPRLLQNRRRRPCHRAWSCPK